MFSSFRAIDGLTRWRIPAAWLLIALAVTAGCQAVDHEPAPSASLPPVRPTLSPGEMEVAASTPGAQFEFGSLAVSLDNEDIWLLAGEGPPRQLAQGKFAVLSPDGCKLVFMRDPANPPGYPEYWAMSIHDATPRWLASPFDTWGGLAYGMAWSPDSTGLAVTTGASIKRVYAGTLYWVDISDGHVMQWAESGAGEPHFSPDGEWIATTTPEIGWSRGTVALWNVNERTGRMVFDPVLLSYVRWADDSRGFAVALLRYGGTGLELWWVPVDAPPVQLGYVPDAIYAAWQPGLERLVYYAPQVLEDPESGTSSSSQMLHLVDSDGGGDVEIPGSQGMQFWTAWFQDLEDASAWSPDGRWLLTFDGEGRTYIVDTDVLQAPQPLSVDRVHGWLDAGHYLASVYQAGGTDLYYCVPPATCYSLERLDGRIQRVSYASRLCEP